MILNEFFNLPQVFEKDMEEGIFDKKKPAEPFEFYLDGCDPHAVKKYLLNKFGSQGWRVAGPGAGASRVFVAMSPELYPTGNEAKWDIESNCGEQGMAEGTRERLSNLHDKIRKEKGLPDPKEYLKIAQQKKKEIADLKAQNKKEVGEGKGDYVPPKEADYGDKYQAMVKRVGEKARAQEKAKQQQPKQPVRESRLALLKQIIQS